MSKIDLSPITKGHNKGYTFKQHITTSQNLTVFFALLGFNLIVIFYQIFDVGFEDLLGYICFQGGVFFILCVFIVSVFKHWAKLKRYADRGIY